MSLLDQSLGRIACEIPGATLLFHQHKLDFCCGGKKTLREAATLKHLDADALAEQLAALASPSTDAIDWRQASSSDLITHILANFHELHRQQLPELIRMARRVEQVHGALPTCPTGLANKLADMHQELESHMQKEEQVLFPMLRSREAADLPGPITMMRFEHDQHGESLAGLEALTHDFTPPPEACNTWRALYLGLRQFRQDLMQHIHLENNILFSEHHKETDLA